MNIEVSANKGGMMDEKRPGGQMRTPSSSEPSPSALNPLSVKAGELLRREHFWPLLALGLVAVLLFYFRRRMDLGIDYTNGRTVLIPYYVVILGAFLSYGGAALILRLTGKRPNYLALALVAAVVCLDLKHFGPLWDVSSGIFRGIGGLFPKPTGFFSAFVKQFFDAGLTEESYKALPLIALLFIGASRWTPWNKRIGIREPLDGIAAGVIAGASFTFVETSFNYFGGQLMEGNATGALTLLMPRLLKGVAGHAAYSGYFGYFIGLAALYPAQRWKLLGIGFVSAAAIHALWNSSSNLGEWFQLVPVILVLMLLGSAILKARELSPNREQLAASQILGGLSRIQLPLPGGQGAAAGAASVANASANTTKSPFHSAGPGPESPGSPVAGRIVGSLADLVAAFRAPADPASPTAPSAATTANAASVSPAAGSGRASSPEPAVSLTWGDPNEVLMLAVGTARIPIALGGRIYERQIPGATAGKADGIIGEINANPADPKQLGLKNLSAHSWTVITAKGEQRELPPGRSILLTRGLKVRLGDLIAEVQ